MCSALWGTVPKDPTRTTPIGRVLNKSQMSQTAGQIVPIDVPSSPSAGDVQTPTNVDSLSPPRDRCPENSIEWEREREKIRRISKGSANLSCPSTRAPSPEPPMFRGHFGGEASVKHDSLQHELEEMLDVDTVKMSLEKALDTEAVNMNKRFQNDNMNNDLSDQMRVHLQRAEELGIPSGDRATISDEDLKNLDEPRAKFFKVMADKNWEFDARGAAGNPAGGQWQRFINSKTDAGRDTKKRYEALGRNPEAQRAFRANWLKDTYQEWKKEKVKSISQTRKTFSDERFFVLNRIIVEEGGGPRGALNATNYCLKCVAMGPPYYKFCSWRKDYLYLYKTEGIEETYQERWEITKTEFNQGTKTDWVGAGFRAASETAQGAVAKSALKRPHASLGEAAEAPQQTDKQPATETADDTKDGAKGDPVPESDKRKADDTKVGAKEDPVPESDKKKGKSPGMILVGKAKATKLAFGLATAAAETVVSNITKETDENWKTFNSPAHLGPLEQAQLALTIAKSTNNVFNKFISQDIQMLYQSAKAKKDDDYTAQFERWMTDFCEKLDPAVEKLNDEARMLCSMHATRESEKAKRATPDGATAMKKRKKS